MVVLVRGKRSQNLVPKKEQLLMFPVCGKPMLSPRMRMKSLEEVGFHKNADHPTFPMWLKEVQRKLWVDTSNLLSMIWFHWFEVDTTELITHLKVCLKFSIRPVQLIMNLTMLWDTEDTQCIAILSTVFLYWAIVHLYSTNSDIVCTDLYSIKMY